MKILTKDQLAEVDRIIENVTTQTDWGRDDNDNSIEVDDVNGTLREAARQVRRYLSSLEPIRRSPPMPTKVLTIAVDGETLVKAIATRLETESSFLSPEPATFIIDPRGILKLVEDAGATPEQIDAWIEEVRNAN